MLSKLSSAIILGTLALVATESNAIKLGHELEDAAAAGSEDAAAAQVADDAAAAQVADDADAAEGDSQT